MLGDRRAAAILGAAIALGACSGAAAPDEPREHSGSVAGAVINGTASTYAQNAVVLLQGRTTDGAYSCTGTLVAPNLVLTARHCVSATVEAGIQCSASGMPIANGTFGADVPAGNLVVYTGLDARRRYYAKEAADAAGEQIVRESSAVLCNADVAFIVLDHDLPGRFAPLRVASGAAPGEKLTAVGWGLEGSGSLPKTRVQRPDVPVRLVGPVRYDADREVGLGESEFLTGESICNGDSGGPMFSAQGAVVGVVSRGGGGNISANSATACIGANASSIFTHLGNKQDLIARAFAAAGATLRTENDRPKQNVGAACAQSFDCASDACVEGRCRVQCGDPGCTLQDQCATFEDKKVCIPSPDPAPVLRPSTPVTPAGAIPTNNSGGGCAAACPGLLSGESTLVVALGAAALACARRRRATRAVSRRSSP